MVDEDDGVRRVGKAIGVRPLHRRGHVLEGLRFTEAKPPPSVRVPAEAGRERVRQVRDVMGEEGLGHEPQELRGEERDDDCRKDEEVHVNVQN